MSGDLQLRFERQEVVAEIRWTRAQGLEVTPPLREKIRKVRLECVSAFEPVKQDRAFVAIGQVAPIWDLDQEAESVRKCGIEGLDAVIDIVAPSVIGGGRVHCGPAVFQIPKRDALDAPLVDNGEQFVLEVWAGPIDLIEKHHLRIPDSGWRRDVPEGCLLGVGYRNPDQIVVVHERCVVEPVIQSERFGQAFQQEAFCGAMFSDEEQRLLRDQRGEQNGFEVVPSVKAER